VSFFISSFLFSGIAVRDFILSICAKRAREKFALFVYDWNKMMGKE